MKIRRSVMVRKPAHASPAVKLTGGQQPAALDVQAMAGAETGQFDDAVQIQQQAVKLIKAGDQKRMTLRCKNIWNFTRNSNPGGNRSKNEDIHARTMKPAMTVGMPVFGIEKGFFSGLDFIFASNSTLNCS